MQFTEILDAVIEFGASDLHLQAGNPAQLRIGGVLKPLEGGPLTDDEIRDVMRQIALDDPRVKLDNERAADCSWCGPFCRSPRSGKA